MLFATWLLRRFTGLFERGVAGGKTRRRRIDVALERNTGQMEKMMIVMIPIDWKAGCEEAVFMSGALR